MNTYYVPAFGLDDNLQCSDDHFYLRCIFKCTLHIHKLTHTYIYIPTYILYIIYTYAYIYLYRAFLVANLVKNSPAMPEMLVRFLGQKDPMEKG